MTVLVTGVGGFIGSTLAERLVRDGEEVVGIDNFSDYYDPEIKRANLSGLTECENFRLVEGDLNRIDLGPIVRGLDAIYHQAGQPGVRQSWGNDFVRYVDANIAATQKLLESARSHAPRLTRFVYASSSSVYGDAEQFPTRELDRPQPRSPYGVTKLAAEHLVTLYATNYQLPTISLRYFTVYGPRQRPDMAFNRFISSALRGEPLPVYGSGDQIREFTYVDDIVDANLLASTAHIDPGTVVNLSGGSAISVNSVLDLLSDLHGQELQIDRGEPALGDVTRTGGDTELARALLGWKPRVTIEEGLALEYEWLAASDC